MSAPPHTSSKFTPFSLMLSNGATLTGLSHLTTPTEYAHISKPLLVGIHGGTCSANYYDLDAEHTASLVSSALEVPFVAINRPAYAGSTTIIPCENFHMETGRWLHEYILPAIWREFGSSNGCSSIVTTSHSMAVPAMIICASMYGKEQKPVYPLAGLVLSGWGRHSSFREELETTNLPPMLKEPLDMKIPFMLGDPSMKLYEPSILERMEVQNVGMSREESHSGMRWFQQDEVQQKYCAEVTVPVLYGVGDHDMPWRGTKERVHEFAEMFVRCPNIESSVVTNAPHAIEWSKAGKGWYAKSFVWALKVTVDMAFAHREFD